MAPTSPGVRSVFFSCCKFILTRFRMIHSLRRFFGFTLIVGLLVLTYIWFKSFHSDFGGDFNIGKSGMRTFLVPDPGIGKCALENRRFSGRKENDEELKKWIYPAKKSRKNKSKNQRILLIPETSFSSTHKAVTELVVALRMKYKLTIAGKNLPDLLKIPKGGFGRYGTIFFEDYRSYLEMDSWNREILDKYCKAFNVGLIAMVPPLRDFSAPETDSESLWDSSPGPNGKAVHISVHPATQIEYLSVNATSPLPRISRGGAEWAERDVKETWSELRANHPTFTAVLNAKTAKDGEEKGHRLRSIVLADHGHVDGVRKVLFGGSLRHWMNQLLFMDALHWLSNGKLSVPLKRYVLVDIDDVFVGKNRFIPGDVEALLESQNRLLKVVKGFKYNLGFSGGYFHNGLPEENSADDLILKKRNEFWWFPHMFLHSQAHTYENVSDLIQTMALNKRFAEEKKIPVNFDYAVAPHHSGVYPVHGQLYEAWKKVWGIKVTSTEEYPHLRPARLRRGFIHEEIAVLPRQTCGLYTKNLYYDEYPNGPEVLEAAIKGGELFQTLVYNPVSVFMTHMPNYVLDRLAPYAFESVANFVGCYTNLELVTKTPTELAKIYFENLFPEDKIPMWGNPCDDKRHLEIWSGKKSCDRFPDFLVIGPQKTGSTALHSFLNLHPAIRSNNPSPETFEETHFFSQDKFYSKGIDWYANFFPQKYNQESDRNSTENENFLLFEKSADYFDKDQVPARVHRMLPRAKIIVILISPSKRAYSWYHHMRAHDDPTALNTEFFDVISAGEDAPPSVKQLQSRCLEPGKYVAHLERWLNFYNGQNQLRIVDGELLRTDPVQVLNDLQKKFSDEDLPFFADYTGRLRYDEKKGFFCPIVSDESGRSKKKRPRVKCLGKGKGRIYPPMEDKSIQYLKNYYRLYNEALVKMLTRLGYSIPKWLEDEL